jgi:hypothetical protein
MFDHDDGRCYEVAPSVFSEKFYSAKASNQLNSVIRETLRHNLAAIEFEDIPGFYFAAPEVSNNQNCVVAARGAGFGDRIPVIYAASSDASAHDRRKVFLLWDALFDNADIASLSIEEWKAAFRTICESTIAIALTRTAWRDGHLLPITFSRQSFLPPLIFPEKEPSHRQVLLIDHEANEREVEDTEHALRSAGFEAVVWSNGSTHSFLSGQEAGGDIFAPAVHLHLGSHSVYERPIRIIDSWNNRRCVIQHVRERSEARDCDDAIKVENGVNGVLTRSMDELLFALRTLEQDEALRNRVTSISVLKSRQLSRQWQSEIKAMLE